LVVKRCRKATTILGYETPYRCGWPAAYVPTCGVSCESSQISALVAVLARASLTSSLDMALLPKSPMAAKPRIKKWLKVSEE
jgi:hypothetical protein